MKTKRDRLAVIYTILKVIREHDNSIRPTPLLRRSNLSSNNFKNYLKDLLSKGLIKEIAGKEGRKCITLTDKGFEYLQKYKLILGFIEEFEL